VRGALAKLRRRPWRAYQAADAESRKAMLLPDTGPRKRRRRRRKKPPADAAAPETA
jgi:poly(A) polymerase